MNINKININQTEPTYYITSDIYDVSYHNNGATFESLQSLLSSDNLSTLIPIAVRCGGMTIRFVQSSDNKYVQYRLMANIFSTDKDDWQGIDDEPTAGSDNLVKSGGVRNELDNKVNKIHSSNLIDPSKIITYRYINAKGDIATTDIKHYCISDRILVVVDGVGKDVISNAIDISYARAWVVYDANGNKLRWASVGEVQYTYQDGDAYIILGLNSDNGTAYANYGTVLIQEEYTDYLPVMQIEKKVDDLEVNKFAKSNIIQQIGNNTDKVMSQNAVTEVLYAINNHIDNIYIDSLGDIKNHDSIIQIAYIKETGMISTAFAEAYKLKVFAVTANKKYAIVSKNSSSASPSKIAGFTQDVPDIGVVLSLITDDNNIPSGERIDYTPLADGYIVLYYRHDYYDLYELKKEFPLYESVDNLEQNVQDLTDRVNAISVEPIDTEIVTPTTVYSICESKNIDKNMTAVLYADHFVSTNPNSKPRFKSNNNDKLLVFSPINESRDIFNEGVDKYTHNLQDSIAGGVKEKSFSIQHRSILNSATKNLNIRILCIGDSVTNGTGANFPVYITIEKKLYNYPTYLKKMSLLDHDLYNEGFQLTSIGRNTKYSISHNGQTIPVWTEGRGGWQVAEYCFCKDATEAEGNNYVNYFYDANKIWQNEDLNTVTYTNSKGTFTGVKFSLQSYINKYKTLADDGVTRLVVGSTAGTEVTDVNAYDVCTPNVVVIQLCHNGTQSNFEKYIDYLIAAIKEEFPDMPIVISLIDTVGTYNPELYPEFDNGCIDMNSSHNRFWSLVAKHKQLENEENGIYIAWNMFIQPTAYSIPTRLLKQPESLSLDKFDNFSNTGAGYFYHPSTLAHATWAYQLYAMSKWILL